VKTRLERRGDFVHRVATGADRGHLRVGLRGEGVTISATKADVDAHVRRIRPDDLDQLHGLDEQIEETADLLAQLRQLRLDFLHDAFQRGHKVPLRELLEEARRRAGGS
jgi:hypothetical protein